MNVTQACSGGKNGKTMRPISQSNRGVRLIVSVSRFRAGESLCIVDGADGVWGLHVITGHSFEWPVSVKLLSRRWSRGRTTQPILKSRLRLLGVATAAEHRQAEQAGATKHHRRGNRHDVGDDLILTTTAQERVEHAVELIK